MSSFASAHGDSTPAQAPAGATSGQILVKPVPWQLESKFKMMTVLKPAPLIAANATLEQDKATILRCWLEMGGEDDILRRKYMAVDSGWSMRDEPSDDVSEWFGVTVEGERVTRLRWNHPIRVHAGFHQCPDYGLLLKLFVQRLGEKNTNRLDHEIKPNTNRYGQGVRHLVTSIVSDL